jgi:hypothetical protein
MDSPSAALVAGATVGYVAGAFRHDRRPWQQRVADFREHPDYEMPDPS